MRKEPVLILISGPPRAGKSRFGRYLSGWLRADHFALSDKLKELVHQYYGIAECDIMAFEDCKDETRSEFNGKTPRQAYIEFSEEILKPHMGSAWLGKLVVKRVAINAARGTPSVISGVGFIDEVRPLIDMIGADRCLHIRVLPTSGSPPASEDSRGELDLEALGVPLLAMPHTTPLDFVHEFRRYLASAR